MKRKQYVTNWAMDKAIERAKINKKPTLIEIKTVLGRDSVYQGKNIVHGKPLSKEDMSSIREKLNIKTKTFEITENAVRYLRESIKKRVTSEYNTWQNNFNSAKNTTNENLKRIINFIENKDIGLNFAAKNFQIQNDYNEELRESNSKMLNIISDRSKFFLGGSADLATSCHTSLYKEINFSSKYRTGKNLCFGVRENAMGAILNGKLQDGLNDEELLTQFSN